MSFINESNLDESQQDMALIVAAKILASTASFQKKSMEKSNPNNEFNFFTNNEKQKKKFLEWMSLKNNNLYPTKQDKEELAKYLNVSYLQVKKFDNFF